MALSPNGLQIYNITYFGEIFHSVVTDRVRKDMIYAVRGFNCFFIGYIAVAMSDLNRRL